MKILCVTDQSSGSCHSSIEGIFNGPLRESCDIHLVFFSRDCNEAVLEGNRLDIPYRYKRRGAAAFIGRLLDLDSFDIVIVRNFFPVLRSFLRKRDGHRFKLGFWNSFPHTFRRYFQAVQESRSLLRKRAEYAVRSFFEKRLVSNCDFLIVMSEEFKRLFFCEIDIACLYLPMGFNPEEFSTAESTAHSVRKFIYTGAIDALLQTDLVVKAMAEMPEAFQLDLYTASNNATVDRIRQIATSDDRIRLIPALPRKELFNLMKGYDVGIGFKPENPLYNVSSPTKTVEYYALGIPALVNYLPEYRELFDEWDAFFCDFTSEEIKRGVRRILQTDKKTLVAMGAKGRQAIETSRNYRTLSKRVFDFLQTISKEHCHQR
jgi:hypothetical protein